jgi:DNA-directed RNA polymerase subunit RPC12/RpoP
MEGVTMRSVNESGLTKRDSYNLDLIKKERYKRDHYLNCMRCGHAWRPFVDRPKACPGCGSRIWDKPKTTNPEDITVVRVYGEAHQYYGHHYHIRPFPSFPQSMIVDLLLERLKLMLKTDSYNEDRNRFEGRDYRLYLHIDKNTQDGFYVGMREGDSKHFERLFKLTGRERIHVLIYDSKGMDLLLRSISDIFPNAKIEKQESNS